MAAADVAAVGGVADGGATALERDGIQEGWRLVDGLLTFSRTVGEGPDVVLVHGAGVSSEYWRPAQKALAALGPFRVHALDFPGFGRSEDADWPPEVPRLAEHLRAWLRQAVPEPFHLVGQSLGCEIAVLEALAEPERVRSLVLAGPASLPELRSLALQAAAAAVDALAERPGLYRAIVPDYLRCGPRRLWRALWEQKKYPDGSALARVQTPTLVVRGARDPLVPRGRAERVAERLPRGETAVAPGAHGGHYTHPAEFAAVVAPFLRWQS